MSEYNGWKNWDTWEVYMWLSSDESGLTCATRNANDRKEFESWLAYYVKRVNWFYHDSISLSLVDVDEIIEALLEE